MTITGDFEQFQNFKFRANFLENKSLFKKLRYRFLFKITIIENATFLYKTALNRKTEWGVQNVPITKKKFC